MFIILYVLLALASVANALELKAWNNLTGPSHNVTVNVNLNNRCFPNWWDWYSYITVEAHFDIPLGTRTVPSLKWNLENPNNPSHTKVPTPHHALESEDRDDTTYEGSVLQSLVYRLSWYDIYSGTLDKIRVQVAGMQAGTTLNTLRVSCYKTSPCPAAYTSGCAAHSDVPLLKDHGGVVRLRAGARGLAYAVWEVPAIADREQFLTVDMDVLKQGRHASSEIIVRAMEGPTVTGSNVNDLGFDAVTWSGARSRRPEVRQHFYSSSYSYRRRSRNLLSPNDSQYDEPENYRGNWPIEVPTSRDWTQYSTFHWGSWYNGATAQTTQAVTNTGKATRYWVAVRNAGSGLVKADLTMTRTLGPSSGSPGLNFIPYCPLDCSGRGTCTPSPWYDTIWGGIFGLGGDCVCNPGYTGFYCEYSTMLSWPSPGGGDDNDDDHHAWEDWDDFQSSELSDDGLVYMEVPLGSTQDYKFNVADVKNGGDGASLLTRLFADWDEGFNRPNVRVLAKYNQRATPSDFDFEIDLSNLTERRTALAWDLPKDQTQSETLYLAFYHDYPEAVEPWEEYYDWDNDSDWYDADCRRRSLVAESSERSGSANPSSSASSSPSSSTTTTTPEVSHSSVGRRHRRRHLLVNESARLLVASKAFVKTGATTGLPSWFWYAIGGGGALVVIIISVVTWRCMVARRRRRLASLHPDQHGSPAHGYVVEDGAVIFVAAPADPGRTTTNGSHGAGMKPEDVLKLPQLTWEKTGPVGWRPVTPTAPPSPEDEKDKLGQDRLFTPRHEESDILSKQKAARGGGWLSGLSLGRGGAGNSSPATPNDSSRPVTASAPPLGVRGGSTETWAESMEVSSRLDPAANICVVCTDEYCSGDTLRALPCSHYFHARCVDPWLQSRGTCPTCRMKISCQNREEIEKALKQLPRRNGKAFEEA